MKELIRIDCSGILDKEIILSALQGYRSHCQLSGNRARADRVQDIINRINFK